MNLDHFLTTMKILHGILYFRLVYGVELLFHSEDKGGVNSEITPNVAQFYTRLSDYGIIPTEYMSITFDLKACYHAYVMLSPSRELNSTDFYEIVLGGYSNTKVIIRRSNIRLADETMTDILKCDEFRRFTISWYDFGTIVVQMATTNVKGHDNDILLIKGFGIMTSFGATGTWRLSLPDCRNNSYGYHCEKPCGHCYDGELCNKYNGSCRNGCEENWQGEMCDAMVYPKCSCPCVKTTSKVTGSNLTGEKLLASLKPKIAVIEKELAVNKTNLSSSKRKLTSAPDNRMTSKSIGIVGAVFLTVVVGLLVLIDLSGLIKS